MRLEGMVLAEGVRFKLFQAGFRVVRCFFRRQGRRLGLGAGEF
jgi:hypothetical protein